MVKASEILNPSEIEYIKMILKIFGGKVVKYGVKKSEPDKF